MVNIGKGVLLMAWFAAALTLDVLAVRTVPPRAAALLLASQLPVPAWLAYCLFRCVSVAPTSDGNGEGDDGTEEPRA